MVFLKLFLFFGRDSTLFVAPLDSECIENEQELQLLFVSYAYFAYLASIGDLEGMWLWSSMGAY